MKPSYFNKNEIEGFNLMKDAEREVLEADSIFSARGPIMKGAENSVILTDELRKFEGNLGDHVHFAKSGEPNVIAAKNFRTNSRLRDDLSFMAEAAKGIPLSVFPGTSQDFGYFMRASKQYFVDNNLHDDPIEIDENMAVLIQNEPNNLEEIDGRQNISIFEGEWDNLAEYLSEATPNGDFQLLRAFTLPDRLQNVSELESFVSEYSTKYEEIKDELETYDGLKNELNLDSLEDDNEKLYETLVNFDEEIDEIVKSEFNLSEYSIDSLNESNDKMYLLRNLSNLEARLEDRDTDVDDFLQIFNGEVPDGFLLEPGFQQRYFTDGDSAVDSKDEANEAFYEQGIDQLERIARGQGKISLEESEINELELELKGTIEEIKSSSGRPSQELIQRKNQLKEQITEQKRQKAFEELNIDYDSGNPDYSELSPLEVRKALDQLGQEYLENCKAKEKTREIASNIDVSNDVGNGYVDFEVWDKSLETLPHDDRSVPCSFPGGSREQELLGYMLDPRTQIAKLEAGDDKGAVISNLVEHQGEDYLFVHSVESDDGITSRNDISLAIKEHIEDYAEEAGVLGVVYSTDNHNSAAQDFVETLEREFDYQNQELELDKVGDDVYLDVEFPTVNGYLSEI